MQFTAQHEILMSSRLSGKSIVEAAKDAGYTHDHAKQLFSGKRHPDFAEEYQRRLAAQSEALAEVAKRSKEGLLTELEEIAEICREGQVRYTKDGHEYTEQDLTNWIRSIVERGKLQGYYVDKTEHSGILQTQALPVYNTDNLTDAELAVHEALERKLTSGSAGAEQA